MKPRNSEHRIFYPVNIALQNEGKIKIFSDKGKGGGFVARRHGLKESRELVVRPDDGDQI